MPQESNLRKARLGKLNNIIKAGINPYPSKAKRTNTCEEAINSFDKLSKKELFLAGRIRSIRSHGGSTFCHIEDGTARIQIYLQKDVLGEKKYKFFENFDIGDFIQVSGKLFKTKRGEKTLKVSDFVMLVKSLRPLPEKWHGLKDQETRYRKRYLDLIMNEKTREIFQKRAEFIDAVRDFLTDRNFLEVETPVLQPTAGGATAQPFVTHHNVLDIDLYLRIAPEIYLKELIVGGFEKIFELGKTFRNEGISTQHLQEFTIMEYYWAYANYKDSMKLNEEMFEYILKRVFGTLKFEYEGKKIDFKIPWPRIDFKKQILKDSKIDLDKYPDKNSLAKKLKELKIDFEKNAGRGKLIDTLYKNVTRPKLIQPTYIINHPLDLSPLAKKPNANANTVERYQLVTCGFELLNGYSELNDPIDQKKRFEAQTKLREKGDIEAHMMDEDFVEALEYAMPPTTGLGLGIDRMMAILTNSRSVRDVVFFPQMRPKNAD